MKSKKIINLLSTIAFVILFLVTLTGCEQKNVKDNETNNTTVSKEKANFTMGEYSIQIDKSILDDTEGIAEDESIEFLEGNTFNAYTGFGNCISGTYTVSDSKIDCIANTFHSEYGPNQEINASMSFKINNKSEIELIGTSETYQIKIVDIPNNTLTNETKDMSLWPFVKGIKFILSK